MTTGISSVVEYSPNHPKVQGLPTLRGEKKLLEKVGVTYLKHDQWKWHNGIKLT